MTTKTPPGTSPDTSPGTSPDTNPATHPATLTDPAPDAPYAATLGPTAAFTVPEGADLGTDAPPLSLDDYTVHVRLVPSREGPPLLLETARQVRSRYAYYRMQETAKLEGVPELQEARARAVDAERDAVIHAMRQVAERHGHLAVDYSFQFRTPTVYDVEEAEAQTLAPRSPAAASSTPLAPGGQPLVQPLGQPLGPGAAAPRTLNFPPVYSGAPAFSVDEREDPEAKYPVRARSRFRRHLAARTFLSTNYPKFDALRAWDVPGQGAGFAQGQGAGFAQGQDVGSVQERRFDAFSALPYALQESVTTEVVRRIAFETDALAFLESWEPAC